MKHKVLPQSSLAVLLLGACSCLTSGIRVSAQTALGQAAAGTISASSIQIEPVESDEATLTPEFRVAIYENLVDEVAKMGNFQHVYRSGDRAAAGISDILTLHTRVVGFTEGSQKKREVTTIAGATIIKANVQLVNREGRIMVNRDVEAKVRFFGENLNAAGSLAKKAAKMIRLALLADR
jgi:hypothetical protein